MPYDLLIKNGTLLDPAQHSHGAADVAIQDGQIARVEPDIPSETASQVMDGRGMLVVPGLIDLHTHVARDIVALSADPDAIGVHSGVTTLVDAGSVGFTNFPGFRKFVIAEAQTDVFSFLHLSPVGEVVLPETAYEAVDTGKMLALIEANRDRIKGIKIRAVANFIHDPQDLLATARAVASQAGLPLMVHLGLDRGEQVDPQILQQFTNRLLDTLEQGDILTHVYTYKPGAVISPEGEPLLALQRALERGVLLDVATSFGHLSIPLAQKAMRNGLLPHTLSTDLTAGSFTRPELLSLTSVMSLFMAMGLSLGQVVAMASANPASAIREQTRRGAVKAGMLADLTLLEQLHGDFLFGDGAAGNFIHGESYLVPKQTIKNGRVFTIRERFERDILGNPLRRITKEVHKTTDH